MHRSIVLVWTHRAIDHRRRALDFEAVPIEILVWLWLEERRNVTVLLDPRWVGSKPT